MKFRSVWCVPRAEEGFRLVKHAVNVINVFVGNFSSLEYGPGGVWNGVTESASVHVAAAEDPID